MNNTPTVQEIRDRIASYQCENHYEAGDILKLLEIIDALACRVEQLERPGLPAGLHK